MAEAVVGIVMGSDSDWPLVKKACETLDKFGVPYETRVISAHRTPDVAIEDCKHVVIACDHDDISDGPIFISGNQIAHQITDVARGFESIPSSHIYDLTKCFNDCLTLFRSNHFRHPFELFSPLSSAGKKILLYCIIF